MRRHSKAAPQLQSPPTKIQKNAQPPCMTKPTLVGITFDKNAFPVLKTTATPTTKSQPANLKETTTATNSSSPQASATTAPAYDYKKDLERISNEIETSLKKQFETMFAQLEQKLDHFMRQSVEQREEQESSMPW